MFGHDKINKRIDDAFSKINDEESRAKQALETTKEEIKNYAYSEASRAVTLAGDRARELVRPLSERVTAAESTVQEVKTAATAATTRQDARADQAQQQIVSLEGRLAGMTTEVRALGSIMSVVAPAAPATATPEAVHAFLAETNDKGYDAMRKGIIAKAIVAGRTDGAVKQQLFVKYGDNDREGSTSNYDAVVIPADGIHVYVKTRAYNMSELAEIVSKCAEGIVQERRDSSNRIYDYTQEHSYIPSDLARESHLFAGTYTRLSNSDEIGVAISHRKTDSWGQKLAKDGPAMLKAVAYGAFLHMLDDEKLEAAGNIYASFLADTKDPVMLGELAKAVEAHPTMVRYLSKPMEDMKGAAK